VRTTTSLLQPSAKPASECPFHPKTPKHHHDPTCPGDFVVIAQAATSQRILRLPPRASSAFPRHLCRLQRTSKLLLIALHLASPNTRPHPESPHTIRPSTSATSCDPDPPISATRYPAALLHPTATMKVTFKVRSAAKRSYRRRGPFPAMVDPPLEPPTTTHRKRLHADTPPYRRISSSKSSPSRSSLPILYVMHLIPRGFDATASSHPALPPAYCLPPLTLDI
jgi:hypothetical protein